MLRMLVFLGILLIGGCSNDRDRSPPARLPSASLPGVYTGIFPCDGCPGIATTLWLHADNRFFFEQKYPEIDDRKAMNAYSLGRWSWRADEDVVVLHGGGPPRAFDRVARDTLAMQTDSDLEYRLNRDPAAADFSAVVRMNGTVRMQHGAASFAECLTGLVAPVDKSGDFARFLHQYQSVGARGRPAFVELEGRFRWSRDGSLKSLTIERFITIRPDGAC